MYRQFWLIVSYGGYFLGKSEFLAIQPYRETYFEKAFNDKKTVK